MVFMKACSIIVLFLVILSPAWAHNDVDIKSIEFDVYKSFDVMNARTGRTSKITPRQNKKVKIVGKNKWAYIIRVVDESGNVAGPSYLVAHKWAKRALNIQAALHAARIQKVVETATLPPEPDCKNCGIDVDSTPEQTAEPVTAEDLQEPEDQNEPVVTDNRNWKPGCEVLARGSELSRSDAESLNRCVRSIQRSVAEGARDRNGSLNRAKAFKNLYSRLNKEEQRFAAHIFTAQGEAAILTSARPPRYEEMVAVMKVVDNRMNASNNNRRARQRPFNELDVVLDPWQFSMYNANDPGWRRSLDIDHRTNFSNAVNSYIKYVSADMKPRPEVDRVYHYHANYVSPDWRNNSKKVTISVDGKSVLGGTRTKHYFYRDIAWSRNPKIPWRG